ncbi:putative mitogen-activated protein kinase kinase kinase STE-STE11 family [Helianthus annuus]|uniref:Mitogen-activated protein kinase kinase kinase STE-STE11 family n=1 Tax=Helianthus annuus TaxID=4232 RepID=A0A251VP07_HELAN|nr:mitogen-activated protein kinase kinase kinase 18 [Helianthus annuus]KAF5821675.1 putative mitogen-activated protein kinase kinase kinase STE-STE11 family [Helianthus annuus]KAJ0611320.1 putative mitogen-activated protein kinase kinase kinase STE-STE11 family [Helianthus annuus]KAJ0622319.1 putative mitogen-activated protein kinase kinase kinase STE-STE11 family [Helianthus annuus]KAJ0626594.1 putative mitogen-activated protein kinase kinase kinase STE-STE11 family [Helianthus annuus]KAJ078
MTTTPNWIRGACIGKGSFGTVNLAVDKSNGTIFAVKSVKQNSGCFLEALENEIGILKSLSSHYIIGYRGDDVTAEPSSVPYRNLHMEYMPGGTVADLNVYDLDDVTLQSYTRCITSALSYLHSKKIIHCDVKGKNVLVGSVQGVAKLADFGSAVKSDGRISGTRGSPLWMAPEVVRGEYQGPESDVWSLGCTVIEMITGKPAWQDRGVDTLVQIGYSLELPKLPAQISDELKDFLSKCLTRSVSERWSCDQLLQHPFLLSCSTLQFNDKKWSPRCVFDWSDTNFSDDNMSEVDNSHVSSNSLDVLHRISELSSDFPSNWESDGWETVRNAVVTVDLSISDEEMTVSLPEYSEPVEENNDDEEWTISRSERTNGDSNGRIHNYDQCTNDHAQGTSSGWNSRDTDHNYSCCMLVLLNCLLLFNLNSSDTFIIKFSFCLILDQFLVSDLIPIHYFRIDYLPTFLANEDLQLCKS